MKLFFDSGISLDGYMAGENRSPNNPMGDDAIHIHDWMFKQKAFLNMHGSEGGEEGKDNDLVQESISRAGVGIMGKRMFEEGEVCWPEDLFKTDIYVLTHEKRDPWVQKGSTTFYFINDGIDCALKKAKQSAKGQDIRIFGGANTIQQFLNAGHIDEFILHIAPIILGSGIRLLDKIDKNIYDLEIMEVIPSNMVTHVKYRLIKKF